MDKEIKQFLRFSALAIGLILITVGILNLTNFTSFNLFIPYWVVILIIVIIGAIFLIEYLIKKRK